MSIFQMEKQILRAEGTGRWSHSLDTGQLGLEPKAQPWARSPHCLSHPGALGEAST